MQDNNLDNQHQHDVPYTMPTNGEEGKVVPNETTSTKEVSEDSQPKLSAGGIDIRYATPDPVYQRSVKSKYPHENKKFKFATVVLIITIIACLVGGFFLVKWLIPYRLTLDPNGGIVVGDPVEPVVYKFRDIIQEPDLSTINFKKEGYYLAGWWEDKEGTKDYEFGQEIWWDTTIYAKWVEGYALVLNFADGEENEFLSEEDLKLYHEKWVKPNSKSALPVIYNTDESSIHYGEQLMWFDNAECKGMPISTAKEYTMDKSYTFYGRWFDTKVENFEVDQNGTLLKYKGYCRNLILPSGIKKIKDINPTTFQDNYNDTYHDMSGENFSAFALVIDKLSLVYVNPEMQELGDCSFRGCESLLSVVFMGDNITEFGEYCFAFCESLREIVIPSQITTIKAHTFRKTKSLEEITIAGNVTRLEDQCFAESGVTFVSLSNNVNYIGRLAFAGAGNEKPFEIRLYSQTVVNTNVTIPSGQYCDNLFLSISASEGRLKIYVPEELVDSYKNTDPWSEYKNYISQFEEWW